MQYLYHPLRTANEQRIRMDPKLKRFATLYGEITNVGRKKNDIVIKKHPDRKTPAKYV